MRSLNNVWSVAGQLQHEVVLLSTLTCELVHELGWRVTWLLMTVRMFVYVTLLLVPFMRASFIWILSDNIERGVRYGPNPRNKLDVYYPSDSGVADALKHRSKVRGDTLKQKKSARKKIGVIKKDKNNATEMEALRPVVIFVTGGAWIIGYKNWGAFMGMLLAQCGVIFVSLDYRNFPQGTISEMKEDVTNGIQWVFDHCLELGGDPNRIFLVGQSAGGHISNLVVLERVQRAYFKKCSQNSSCTKLDPMAACHLANAESADFCKTKAKNGDEEENDDCGVDDNGYDEWTPVKLAGFINIAGPCDMVVMRTHLHRRGIYSDMLSHIMGGDLRGSCPLRFLEKNFVAAKSKNGEDDLFGMKLRFADMSTMALLGSSSEEQDDDVFEDNFDTFATCNDDDVDDFGDVDSDENSTLANDSSGRLHSDQSSKRSETEMSLSSFSDSPPRAANFHGEDSCESPESPSSLKKLGKYKSWPPTYYTSSRKKRRKKKVRKYYAKEYKSVSTDAMDAGMEMKAVIELCPVYLLHGAADNSAPAACTVRYAKMLTRLNCETYLKIYEDKTHTGPIIEDPIQGRDPLICDVLRIIFCGEDSTAKAAEDIEYMVHWIEKRMNGNIQIPDFIVSMARFVCPF